MSVATAGRLESTAAAWSLSWIAQKLQRSLLHVAVILLTLIWIIPTLGLLVSSFRPSAQIITTGWWSPTQPNFHFGVTEAIAVVPLLVGVWVLRRRRA